MGEMGITMNIQIQICSLVIMMFLLYFLKRHKVLGLSSEKLFYEILIVSITSVCLDIISVVAINYMYYIPHWLLELICKLYIISAFWLGLLSFAYASTDIYFYQKGGRAFKGYCLAAVIGTVLISVVPIYYYHNDYIVYTYGPSTIAAYTFTFVLLIVTFITVHRHKRLINQRRLQAVKMWIVVWIVSLAIQFIFKSILLIGFASAINMMILFFELENPEANIDKETGVFNSHAMLEYMKQEYRKESTFSAVFITFDLYQNTSAAIERLNTAIKEIVTYFEGWNNIKVFKNVERELIIIADSDSIISEVHDAIQDRFNREWESRRRNNKPIYLNTYYIIINDSTLLNDAEEVFNTFRYFKVNRDNNTQVREFYITKDVVEHKRQQDKIKTFITSAIKDDRVEIFLQPIYNVKEKRFTTAEALIRIRNTDGSIVRPDLFIPIAESSGLIIQLGEIVFKKVCRMIKEYDIKKLGLDYIEVNLSVRQCEKNDFAANYIDIMNIYGIDPDLINLEITETASIHTSATRNIIVKNMEKLIKCGVKFALDDFGNGESNLNYIVDMPVSIVKFDKDMSNAYFQNKKAKFVMDAAMHMIHDMKLEIVAEGIETREQMEKIAEIGIEYIQGYYFSKPLPKDEFIQYIKTHNGLQDDIVRKLRL